MAFTYFFRDLQTLEMICKYALPDLRTKMKINIWDAGCAMGPEPYTLAMLIREEVSEMYFRNISILASDIDNSNLFEEVIDNGSYPRGQVERIPSEIFKKYFERDEKADHFRIIDEIRKSVKFIKHDLLTLEPPRKEFGLILCKNVLLHFTEAQRIKVIDMYYESLIDGGYLATEQTQKMPKEFIDRFEQVVPNAQLYKKKIGGR